jgi:uncharacterized RDD family membrane protein YckC
MERDIAVVTPQSAVQEDIAARVQRLLRAYQQVFELVGSRHTMFWWMPNGHRFLKKVKTPRLRQLVPVFTSIHAARSSRQLKRRLNAAAVSANEPKLFEREIALLERFEESLPSVPTRTMISALVIGVLALSYGTASSLGGGHDDLQPLGDLIGGVFLLSRSDIVHAIQSYQWHAKPIYFTALGLTFSLWVLLLLPITSFRLKRTLFNLCPDHAGNLDAAANLDARAAHDGIYALERELFERLGGRAPREVRFDLALDAALTGLAAIVGVYLAVTVIHDQRGAGFLVSDLRHPHDRAAFQFLATALLIVLSLSRLSMIRTIRRSQGRAPTPAPAHAALAAARLPATLPAASWSRRAGAWLIDLFVIYLLLIPVAAVGGAIGAAAGDTAGGIAIYGLFAIVPPLYVAASRARGGAGYATPGKCALKIRVVDADGSTPSLKRLLVREILLKWIVFSPLFAGFIYPIVNYLRPLWNDRRSTFYDDMLDMRVVHVAPERVAEALAVAVA